MPDRRSERISFSIILAVAAVVSFYIAARAPVSVANARC